MGYCPSQDWDRHVAEEDRQAEARAAFFTAHADKIATVAAGSRCLFPSKMQPHQLTDLIEDAVKIVGEIIANGNPPEDDGDIFDGPETKEADPVLEAWRDSDARSMAKFLREASEKVPTGGGLWYLRRRIVVAAEMIDRLLDEVEKLRASQPAGGSTQASELEAAKAKIEELRTRLEERMGEVATADASRARIIENWKMRVSDLQEKLDEAVRDRDRLKGIVEASPAGSPSLTLHAKARAYEKAASEYAQIAGAWYTGRLGRVGLFGKTVAFTVAGRKDEPFTVRTFEVEKLGEIEAYRQALALALGEGPRYPTVEDYREGFENLRDAVLNQRYQLADYDLDSDLVNSILGLIDDNNPETNRVEEGGEA